VGSAPNTPSAGLPVLSLQMGLMMQHLLYCQAEMKMEQLLLGGKILTEQVKFKTKLQLTSDLWIN